MKSDHLPRQARDTRVREVQLDKKANAFPAADYDEEEFSSYDDVTDRHRCAKRLFGSLL